MQVAAICLTLCVEPSDRCGVEATQPYLKAAMSKADY